jgi:hypothetical protein
MSDTDSPSATAEPRSLVDRAPSVNGTGPARTRGLAVIAVFLAVVCSCTFKPELWRRWRVDHIDPLYLDAFAYLAAAEAAAVGESPYGFNTRDPLNRGHVNGRVWIWLGAVGLKTSHAPIAGWFSLVAFTAGIGALLRPPHWGWAMLAIAALASPGVLLGVERANNDLLLVPAVIAAAALTARPGVTAKTLGLALVALAAGAKYFPLAAGILLLAASNRSQAIRLVAVGVALLAGLGFLFAHDPVLRGHGWPDQVAPGMFGASAVLEWSGWSGAQARAACLIGALVAIAAIAVWRSRRSSWWIPHASLPPRALAAVASYAVLIGAYFTAGSYPYRLVWCLPAFGLWMRPQGVLSTRGNRLVAVLIGSALANLLWYFMAPMPPASPSLGTALGFQVVSAAHVAIALVFLVDFAVARIRLLTGRGSVQGIQPEPVG